MKNINNILIATNLLCVVIIISLVVVLVMKKNDVKVEEKNTPVVSEKLNRVCYKLVNEGENGKTYLVERVTFDENHAIKELVGTVNYKFEDDDYYNEFKEENKEYYEKCRDKYETDGEIECDYQKGEGVDRLPGTWEYTYYKNLIKDGFTCN